MIAPVAAVTDPSGDRPVVSPPRPPTLMTRHPIAQIAPNGNPKSQETSALLPFSREIDYFSRRVSLGASTLTRFFTDDYLESHSAAGSTRPAVPAVYY